MGPRVFILQVASHDAVHRPIVHQVTEEGLVPTGGVLHILELKLESERIDAVSE